ncbi:MAG: 50S ribosomal protein L25 [Parcubacteria group bacterium]|nr:50S ribosomal protein L25 [Parcubacteria group bacterium]
MLELKAKIREKLGSKASNKLRSEGFLPAVVYSQGKSNSITVERKNFDQVFKKAGESSIISLDLDGKKELVLIYDIAHDPISDLLTHIDFLGVRAGEIIKARVPLEFVGVAEAEKAGGILIKNIHEVEIEAKVESLPYSIPIDISVLKSFEDNILIKDIQTNSDVKILETPTLVVVGMASPRTEAEIAEIEQPAEFKPEEIKVESEEKRAAKEEQQVSEE